MDVVGYLADFHDDADMVNRSGQWIRGKGEIADRLNILAESGRPELFAADRTTESIRLLTPDTVIVRERWSEPDRVARATYDLTREGGRWLVRAVTVVVVQ